MGDLPEGGAADSTSFQPEIPPENWISAENAAREIIRKVQPTSVSEARRRKVVDYIQKLIRTCLGAEVFPYGSVPLKTYLPDGDIDLTAFGGANIEDILADEMKSILEKEEKNMSAEFVVKDVQLIRAEVKLVKVIVQNIVVDVSFNQIGGLSTLCFLEQVDRLIGKDHLFKYSIILIKAWCYYESRILGAHHGLISTYALETLVLYIFHRFHSSLDGPLAVLYKFLDYFSKFDWDKYSISLNGPVRLSSFPAIVPEMPEDCGDLLLSSDFLNSCVVKFSVPSRSGDKSSRGFQLKHLNIVDPLKETNNLGRSVSKGNFYRIRSAFSYGARKLGHMLLRPEDSIANELHKFFSNTVARHGGAERPDVHKIDKLYEPHDEYAVVNGVFRSGINKLPHDLLKGPERAFDADLATSVLGGLAISTDSSKSPTPMLNESASAIPKPIFIPHHFFANAKLANGSMSNGVGGTLVDENEKVEPTKPKDFSGEQNQIYSNHGSASMSETPEALNSLSDLTGDYESYLQCLQYGRVFYDYVLDVQPLHMTPPSPYQKNNSWDSLLPMSSFKQNGFSHGHHNGFNPNPAMFAMHHALMPGVPFGWEDVSKPRGTGTYFPNLVQNQSPEGYRSSAMKGRNHAPSRSPHNNERNMTFLDQNMLDNRNVMIGSSESHPSFSPRGNSLIIQPEGVVEFEVEKSRQPKPVSSSPKTFSAMKKSKPALSKEQDRISLRSSYRLKDEDDFPPLSV